MELQELQNVSSTNHATASLPKPSDLLNQLMKIQETMPLLLDDFKKQYISYNKNSQNNENQQLYESLQANVENENAKLFMLNNGIEKGMEELTKKLFEYNKKIEIEKKENEKMKKYLARMENEYHGSDEMISNYKEMYRMHYLKNVTLVLGIIIGGVILTKIFPLLPTTATAMNVKTN
jgi:uncharacterized protein YPO0396